MRRVALLFLLSALFAAACGSTTEATVATDTTAGGAPPSTSAPSTTTLSTTTTPSTTVAPPSTTTVVVDPVARAEDFCGLILDVMDADPTGGTPEEVKAEVEALVALLAVAVSIAPVEVADDAALYEVQIGLAADIFADLEYDTDAAQKIDIDDPRLLEIESLDPQADAQQRIRDFCRD